MLTAIGENPSIWKLALREEDGKVNGIYAKVWNETALQVINENTFLAFCTLKLSCVYFSKNKCAITFKVTHAFYS